MNTTTNNNISSFGWLWKNYSIIKIKNEMECPHRIGRLGRAVIPTTTVHVDEIFVAVKSIPEHTTHHDDATTTTTERNLKSQ